MSLFPVALALLPAFVPAAHSYFYIGTYTHGKLSKGIYRASLNTRTGVLSEPVLVAECANPSYLALNHNRRHLYAVDEDDNGSVSAYAVNRHHGLKLLNTRPVQGSAPCDLTVDPKGRNLLVASYVGGILTCLPIAHNGSLRPMSMSIQNKGTGPDKSRQEASHMHWIDPDPTGRFVYSCDLGTDKVQVYRYNSSKGTLMPLDSRTGMLSPGEGPRHGAFDPTHRYLYVNAEMGSSVTSFAVSPRTGALKKLQTLSTLPPGEPTKDKSTAEIELHPSGKWLYVSNRGHDSIAVYKLLRHGRLKLVEITKAGVHIPRGFAIDPSGRWLVVGGQSSDNIAVLKINRANGKLTPRKAHPQFVGSPVCILFAK